MSKTNRKYDAAVSSLKVYNGRVNNNQTPWSSTSGAVQIHLRVLHQCCFAISKSTLVCRGRKRWIGTGTDNNFRSIRRNAVTKNVPKTQCKCESARNWASSSKKSLTNSQAGPGG